MTWRQLPNMFAPDYVQCPCCRCLMDAAVRVFWMVVCEYCGNKRCPHATDHRLECTRSNEPGQAGSCYA